VPPENLHDKKINPNNGIIKRRKRTNQPTLSLKLLKKILYGSLMQLRIDLLNTNGNRYITTAINHQKRLPSKSNTLTMANHIQPAQNTISPTFTMKE